MSRTDEAQPLPAGLRWVYAFYGLLANPDGSNPPLRRGRIDHVIHEPGHLLHLEEHSGVHLLNRWRRP